MERFSGKSSSCSVIGRAAAAIAVACMVQTAMAVSAQADTLTLDADGVAMLFPNAPGSTFHLGSDNPLASGKFKIDKSIAVSYSVMPKRVVNRPYIDIAPFDPATGRPANDWQLLSEYEDVDGKSTGKYSIVIDCGGWQTTFRTHGVRSLDFMLVSLREIEPPR